MYKGYTIQPYSPKAGTAISSHELNQPGTYQDVTDTTVTAQFKLIKDNLPDFLNSEKLDAEMRRVFDICHGCRRCFNLCDSFPKLFDMIDESKNEDVESLSSDQFAPVVDACTLCDMCFMTKCPYVPPHDFDLDFPHLMLRYRTAQKKLGKLPSVPTQLAQIDRNAKIGVMFFKIVNWASNIKNKLILNFCFKLLLLFKARECVFPTFS